VSTVEEALEAGREGVGRIEWARLGAEGERTLLADGISVRCIQRPDGTVPAAEDEPDLQAIVARAY
jgi:prolyl-tRNA synthetase